MVGFIRRPGESCDIPRNFGSGIRREKRDVTNMTMLEVIFLRAHRSVRSDYRIEGTIFFSRTDNEMLDSLELNPDLANFYTFKILIRR